MRCPLALENTKASRRKALMVNIRQVLSELIEFDLAAVDYNLA